MIEPVADDDFPDYNYGEHNDHKDKKFRAHQTYRKHDIPNFVSASRASFPAGVEENWP